MGPPAQRQLSQSRRKPRCAPGAVPREGRGVLGGAVPFLSLRPSCSTLGPYAPAARRDLVYGSLTEGDKSSVLYWRHPTVGVRMWDVPTGVTAPCSSLRSNGAPSSSSASTANAASKGSEGVTSSRFRRSSVRVRVRSRACFKRAKALMVSAQALRAHSRQLVRLRL